ncbi:MAG: hypothetical protein GOP50_04060 [Candidatus Heimdallarchaeota archaeon]|nr:hypothetical protein [Candidatus Heimdallarchaeota archaeon]
MIKISQRGRFCAVCGTKTGPFLNNLCETCYKKEHPLDIEIIKQVNVEICPLCGNLKIQGTSISTWNKEEGLEPIVREVVRRTIIEKIQTELFYDCEFEDNIEEDKIMNYGVKAFEIRTNVTATPFEEFSDFEKEFTTRIKLIRASCNECSKYKSGYFEGILQIRADNRKLGELELERLESHIDQIMKKYEESKMMYILDYEADKDGITCKTSTKYLAETMAREIKSITAGKLTVAYELKTKSRDGTDLYQNTYLVRLPQYTSGDILEFEGIFWVVKNITEAKIRLESLENREMKNFDRKRIKDRGLKKSDSVVSREYMFVSSDGVNATIMALDNYENYDDVLKRLPLNKEIGENIKGFIYEEKNYYLE